MPDEKVLNALLQVFNAAHYKPLSLREVTERLQQRGVYAAIPYADAANCVNNHLCLDQSARFPFLMFRICDETRWGLRTWLPPRPSHTRQPTPSAETKILSIGDQIQHTISVEGAEIKAGEFPLQYGRFMEIFLSMDAAQRENSHVTLQTYASEYFICPVNYSTHCLGGDPLAHWYEENGLQPGDIVWLRVESVRPVLAENLIPGKTQVPRF